MTAIDIVRTKTAQLVRNERGANLVEYIMLLGLIAVLCIAIVKQFGAGLEKNMTTAKEETKELVKAGGGGTP